MAGTVHWTVCEHRRLLKSMSRKQLAALFACGLIGWIVAQGTLALLPVYAVRLGADPALAGNYLALAFGALTVGTVAAGWLSDRFQRRKLMLVVSGLVNIPATWLMGHFFVVFR